MKKIIAGFLIVVLAVFLFVAWKFVIPNFHLGSDGSRNGIISVAETPAIESFQPEPTEESQVSEIRIEWNDIFLDDELCSDEDSLKEKIIELGSSREYHFIHDNATKGTYDKVKSILDELQDVTEIKIVE